MNSAGDGPKAPCGNPEGVKGIMAYRDQYYTGPQEGNHLNGPSLDTTNSTGFNSQSWLSAEQSMSDLTPSSGGGGLFDKGASGGAQGDNNQGTNGSPTDGQSGGPTPNSNSTGRDATADSRNQHLAPGMNNSGRTSFNASPISPQQNLMGTNDISGASGPTFFGNMGDFPGQQQQPQQQNAFSMASNAWGDMPGQQGQVPQQMGDGVLRALMNMGPMDAMDLSSWDQGNENMRQ